MLGNGYAAVHPRHDPDADPAPPDYRRQGRAAQRNPLALRHPRLPHSLIQSHLLFLFYFWFLSSFMSCQFVAPTKASSVCNQFYLILQ